MSCLHRVSALVWMKRLLLLITITISCVYLLSYVSMSDQSKSRSHIQVFMSKLSAATYFRNRFWGVEHANVTEDTINLFEVGTSKEHDIVQRTIAQLNMMTQYGATSRTVNRTTKV